MFQLLRSSSRAATRAGISSSGDFSLAAAALASCTCCSAALRAALRRERFQPAHAGSDAAVAEPADQADIAGAPHMGAPRTVRLTSAERIAQAFAHRYHAHCHRIFAEQRARAGSAEVVERHQPRGDGRNFRSTMSLVMSSTSLKLFRRHRFGGA